MKILNFIMITVLASSLITTISKADAQARTNCYNQCQGDYDCNVKCLNSPACKN
jgi:hypothetical protein